MPARIGITTSFNDGTQSLNRRYVTAVVRAGGTPLPLPMLDGGPPVDDLASHLDGLVVIGGPAVTDGLVGDLASELDPPAPIQAASDRAWIERCWTAGRPILGICYGMQLLNARAGGTIYGDVERQRDSVLPHSHKRDGTSHSIQLASSSRLDTVLEEDAVSVNTRHLQALATVGDGFSVTARAPDGVVEAIEHDNGRVFGVQFHPERMPATFDPLFQSFVSQAESTAAAPAN